MWLILPKISIIVTVDLVLKINYGTFDYDNYEKYIGNYSRSKTFKGCVKLTNDLPVVLHLKLTLVQLTIFHKYLLSL